MILLLLSEVRSFLQPPCIFFFFILISYFVHEMILIGHVVFNTELLHSIKVFKNINSV